MDQNYFKKVKVLAYESKIALMAPLKNKKKLSKNIKNTSQPVPVSFLLRMK